jgi:competence protein ComEC
MIRWLTVLFLLGTNALLWSAPTHNGLTVSFLNIGQGDSILIQGPTGVQVLVDGGPDSGVLSRVADKLPFWDRSLDAVVATHPDADHISGLTNILNRYQVSYIFEPGVENDTKAWSNFVSAVNQETQSGAQHIVARRSMRLTLGGGAHADILYPDSDVSHIKETNAGSIVMHIVYGKTSFLLTGDLPAEQELYLVKTDAKDLASTVLKVGHHGSKNSSTPEFLAAVHPSYGVFSRGCNNRYGHPAPRVVELFTQLKIPTYDTCTEGTITFYSDGVSVNRN